MRKEFSKTIFDVIMFLFAAALLVFAISSCGATSVNIYTPKSDTTIDYISFAYNHQVVSTECSKVRRDSLIDNNGKSEWVKDSFYFFYYITFARDSTGKVLKAKNGADSIKSTDKVMVTKDQVLLDYKKHPL